MIKSAHIENYQSHRNTHLEFAAGVNVLVGSSDSGKSAVLRAINWVLANRPAGDAMRSTWGGDTVVALVTADSGAVTRARAGKKNKYELTTAGGNSIELVAIGQDVPAEVRAALNMADVNVQRQMDSPFLLSADWSPGRVAEYLNEAAGLDVIDRAQANINARLRKIAASREAEAQRLAGAEARLADLEYVDGLETDLAKLEADDARAGRLRAEEQRVNAAVVEIADTEDALAGLPDYRQAERRLAELTAAHDTARRREEKADRLLDAIGEINMIASAADMMAAIIENEPQVDALLADCQQAVTLDDKYVVLAQLITDIVSVTDRVAAHEKIIRAERLLAYTEDRLRVYNKLDAERGELEALLAAVSEGREILEYVGGKLDKMEAAWHEVAPDVCPLCAGSGTCRR